uniref:Probable RNA-binding protein 18 n=1 Tax=Cyprinus carpio TaxID=7962 RepID=A0A8C2AY69_CYPCA
MQSAAETVENASILSGGSAQDGHRLWIGNIDPKITEYHLVKLLEKFGQVKQFDFLFHKSGPLEGQPRGYCFVNFHTKEVLFDALNNLSVHVVSETVLYPSLCVFAVFQKFEPFRGDKNLPASLEPSSSEADDDPFGVNAKIRAIEAKLQMMEENPDDYCGPSAYIYNKPPEKRDKRSQPYHKQFRKFRR